MGKKNLSQMEENAVPEPPAVPFSSPQERKISWFSRYRWVMLARCDWDRGGGDLENIFEPCPDPGCIR